jgi:hypothetical protein
VGAVWSAIYSFVVDVEKVMVGSLVVAWQIT